MPMLLIMVSAAASVIACVLILLKGRAAADLTPVYRALQGGRDELRNILSALQGDMRGTIGTLQNELRGVLVTQQQTLDCQGGGLPVSLISERRTSFSLAFDHRAGVVGAAALCATRPAQGQLSGSAGRQDWCVASTSIMRHSATRPREQSAIIRPSSAFSFSRLSIRSSTSPSLARAIASTASHD
jgi:hypothetical protein